MPYVRQEARDRFEHEAIEEIMASFAKVSEIHIAPGEVNYIISTIIWELFDRNPCYSTANDLMGVLECVKQEFYRRKVAPYEDEKIKENGDL